MVNRPKAVLHGASWNVRKLCRICGEGRPAWVERGPESVCWASETHISSLTAGDFSIFYTEN